MKQVEDSLIRSCQKGDSTAFARLLELIYDMIFRFALKWAGTVVDAEDITQQVCIKLAKAIKQFRFESAFTSWLYRIVVNCARDWARAQSRHRGEEPEENGTLSVQNIEAETEVDWVLKEVDSMGKGYKETVLLVYAEGFSHREAAEVLGVKESTVSWRLHEVRKKLAEFESPIAMMEGVR